LRAAEGQTVPVEEIIAIITPTEEIREPPKEAPPSTSISATPTTASPVGAEEVLETAPKTPRRHYSPLVRRIAEEHGLDLDFLVSTGQLVGSGDNGRITKQDLLNYLARMAGQVAQVREPGDGAKTLPSQPAPGAIPATPPTISPTAPSQPVAPAVAGVQEPTETAKEIVVPFTGMRKMIAEHLSKSAFTAVHVTTVAQADVTKLVAFRAANKEIWEKEHGVRLTYTPFFIKAACDALLAFPMVNSVIEGDKIIAKKYVHMGVAVSLGEGGLIVPVIKDAHKKDVLTLAREVEELARKAREGQLLPSDVQGGTFSITNPGVFGAILSTPIINAPQSAILGVEAIQKMPVVREDDSIAIRSMMYLCLSYDHRVIDGETAIRFLQHIRRTLEDFQFFR
jgi:pyruvate/2-oxoglutarate dehydrogenase complex dihydrolipoamide acyltransferase (E2) component